MEKEKACKSSSLSSALRVFAVLIIIVGIFSAVPYMNIFGELVAICIGVEIALALIMFGIARAIDYLAELVEIARNDKK
ncbi:MAG: hypothetical protein J6L69_06275 [Lachnospiraceae bacterium]|nr:hypothetical protein [Lachnospiraceae bacterium]